MSIIMYLLQFFYCKQWFPSIPKKVFQFVDSLVPTVRRALCDPLVEVRNAAANTFDNLHNTIGSKALDDILPNLLQKMVSQQKKKSTRFEACAHLFKQIRRWEDEISSKSRPLDNKFAGTSARLEISYSDLKVPIQDSPPDKLMHSPEQEQIMISSAWNLLKQKFGTKLIKI